MGRWRQSKALELHCLNLLFSFFQIKRHLFDVLDPRRFSIFSDKILGPFWVLLGGKDQY